MDKTPKLPSWFEGVMYEEGQDVYSAETDRIVELDATAKSMYDLVVGYEFLGGHAKAVRGKQWLKENYPNESKQLFKS